MSIFNSAELEDSVSQGVSELDGEQPKIDLEGDDVKNLKRELHKLKQKHNDISEALNKDNNKDSDVEEFSANTDVEASEPGPMPAPDSDEDSEEGFEADMDSAPAGDNVSRGEIEELRSKVEENEELRQRIEELESELEEVRKEASSSAVEEKVDKTLFDDRLDQLEQKIDEKDPDIEKRLEDIEIEEKVDLSMVEEQFEEFREEIEEEIGSMQNEIEEKTPDKSEVGSLWASLEMLEDRIEALKENTPDNNEFGDKMDTMESKVQSIKNEFSGIESSIEQLKSRDTVTEQEFHEELEDFRRELNQEVSDFDEKISSQYATSKEVSSLWDALKQLEDRQDESESIIDQIDEQGVNEFGRLKDTTKYLEHKIQDLEAMEDKVSQVDMLKQKLEDMEMVVEGMDREAVDKEEYRDLMQDVLELSQLTKKIAQRNQ
jgi:DNA repair exonuclease SbcCD ATPase subunit